MQTQLTESRELRDLTEHTARRFEGFVNSIRSKNPRLMTTADVQQVFDDVARTFAKIASNTREHLAALDVAIADLERIASTNQEAGD